MHFKECYCGISVFLPKSTSNVRYDINTKRFHLNAFKVLLLFLLCVFNINAKGTFCTFFV